MIYVRDDDVLVTSRSWEDPFGRFKQIHEWMLKSPLFVHIPTILVEDLKNFPNAIAYIQEQTQAGKMRPEIHGLSHLDYAKLPVEETKEHLKICKDWIWRNTGYLPTKWYTPWGANTNYLNEISNSEGLKLVDCSNIWKLNGRYGICQELREGKDPIDFLNGKELFIHWWEGGQRLNRIVQAVLTGKWKE